MIGQRDHAATDRPGAEVGTRFFLLGEQVIDRERNLILRNGEVRRVEPKVMEVLVYLAEAGGRIVSRQELMEKVWGVHVVDEAVQRAISLLRAALASDERQVPMVETVRGKGYRLAVATVPIGSPPVRKPSPLRMLWPYLTAAFAAGILATLLIGSLADRDAPAPPPPAAESEREPAVAPPAPR